ncbi:MAG: site-specific integrase [Clostridiales bacterium]|nr:site-specific integrase [Clostridiales bacterium]
MSNIRRDRGDGSVRKRPNGSWEGRFSYTDEDTGKRIDKSVYATTQTEAKRKLKELIKQVENMANDDEYVKPSNLTLGEWLDTWMKEYKKNSVRPATYTSYHHNIEKHIRPALGNVELQKLRPDHIQTLLNSMARGSKTKTPLAPWTVLKVKNILSGALEQAIRNQIMPYNPAKATVPPKLEQKDIRVLTETEQKLFIDALKGHRLEALYLLALATGMRRGEIMALTWDCVDFKNKSIAVKGSISRIKDPDTGITALIYSDPKTKSGRRQIPILPNMIPVLQAHQKRQEAEKAEAGSAWNKQNLVFCSTVGTVIEPRRVCTTMDKITDAAGLPRFTFHALRHTFATRMLEANVPAKVVQDVLGHADVTLTLNTYSHVIGSTAHEQMEKINGLFQCDNETKKRPSRKMSIKRQLADATKEQSATDKQPPAKSKNRDEPEL